MSKTTQPKATTAARSIPQPDYNIFVEGEVVMIKTGGPSMTVIEVCEDCGSVTAVYGNSQGDLDQFEFPPEALVRVN